MILDMCLDLSADVCFSLAEAEYVMWNVGFLHPGVCAVLIEAGSPRQMHISDSF